MEGDPESFDFLYEQYLDTVLSYVLCRIPDQMEAEDIPAETFAAALVALPKFQRGRSALAWLLGITRQKIAEAARRYERTRGREIREGDLTEQERETLGLLFAPDFREMPEEALLHQEAREVMEQLLARLPEPQREALLLQVVHDLSIREIAQVLGRSEAAANSLLQRARAAIFRYGQGYFGE